MSAATCRGPFDHRQDAQTQSEPCLASNVNKHCYADSHWPLSAQKYKVITFWGGQKWAQKGTAKGQKVDSLWATEDFGVWRIRHQTWLELGPQQKDNILFDWLVENKGDPKKAKKQKGEQILVKQMGASCWSSLGQPKKPHPCGKWNPLGASQRRTNLVIIKGGDSILYHRSGKKGLDPTLGLTFLGPETNQRALQEPKARANTAGSSHRDRILRWAGKW